MNKIAFYGSIYSGDPKIIEDLLKEWINTTTLDVKIRLGGQEIVYEDAKIYVYSYNAAPHEGVDSSFLLEGSMLIPLEDAVQTLRRLLELCKKQSIDSDFECIELNEDDEEVSDRIYIEIIC